MKHQKILNLLKEASDSTICNDAYFLVRGDINTLRCNIATEVAFKNCAPSIKCIIKID